jgi:bleomycin hydrolase
MIRYIFSLAVFSIVFSYLTVAQTEEKDSSLYKFTTIKEVKNSSVKDQQHAGTCWSYSSTGMIESEMLRMGKEYINLSEMFIVRHVYEQKAINYVRMHGKTSFSAGGELNDAFDIYREYGIVPEEIYKGLNYGTTKHDHDELNEVLRQYLNGVIKSKNSKLTTAWFEGYKGILDAYLGKLPEEFKWKGKKYTPRTFANKFVGINPDDYYFFTSFTHHPFYTKFVLEIPDNWTWSRYNNIPIDDLMQLIDNSINNDYSVVWASDVSETGFKPREGRAVITKEDFIEDDDKSLDNDSLKQLVSKKEITQELRQKAFDNYQTTDDHGMIITGIAKDQNGNKFYHIKNSWGTDYNDYAGYLYVSEAFVKYKTISCGVHKDVIPKQLKKRFGID